MDITIGIIGTLLGIVGLWYSIKTEHKRRNESLHRQQRFEWNHIYQGVRQICNRLRKIGFKPDFLIGVPGAGIIPTELAVIDFGDNLPIYMIQQLPISSEEEFFGTGGEEFSTEKWRYRIPGEILDQKDKRVLILDDYAPSGDTLTHLKRELISQGFTAENVKTAVLVAPKSLKEASKAPDETWFWVDSSHVYMPWGHGSKRVRKGEVESG